MEVHLPLMLTQTYRCTQEADQAVANCGLGLNGTLRKTTCPAPTGFSLGWMQSLTGQP